MSRKNKIRKLERRYMGYNRTYWKLSHNALRHWLTGGETPEPPATPAKMRAIREQYVYFRMRHVRYKAKEL